MTKDEFLAAMEGPCIEAAFERPSNILDRAALRNVYRAIGSKLIEGLEQVGKDGAWKHKDGSDVTLFRLTLPKEQ